MIKINQSRVVINGDPVDVIAELGAAAGAVKEYVMEYCEEGQEEKLIRIIEKALIAGLKYDVKEDNEPDEAFYKKHFKGTGGKNDKD